MDVNAFPLSTETYAPIAEREWWSQRWIDVLESFGWRRRLERARNYVREGRVLQLEFNGPRVNAQVQGTAPEPYQVSLGLDAFDDEQWHYVIEELSQRAIFAAKLLAGEMPQNIEEAFTASGLSLFPLSKFDIHSTCDCPDPVNPCKHIGAVYYLLGQYFSEDPFILFQLRGRSQAVILETLRQLRSQSEFADAESTQLSASPAVDPALQHFKDSFWRYPGQLDPSLVVIVPPPSAETVLDRLGPLPLPPASGSKPKAIPAPPQKELEALRQLYQLVCQSALMTAMQTRETE